MAELDVVKDEVFSKLPLLDIGQLGQCSVQLNLSIPANKIGKKTDVRSFILRHLTSEEVEDHDDVEEIFRSLLGSIEKILGDKTKTTVKKEPVKMESAETGSKTVDETNSKVSTDGTSTSSDTDDNNNVVTPIIAGGTARVELSRFKEFKVKVGTFGGDCKVNYKSLLYQIEEAKSLKHTDREIVSGIIGGMKTDSALQNYFQGKFNWTLEKSLTYLQNICDVRESTTLLDQMGDTIQEPTETEMNFLLRMMGLRDDIMNITKEEEDPLSERRVQKKFLRALSVGFKKDTIRLTLGPLLKTGSVADHVLMKEVKQAMALQKENEEKTKKGVACNSLNANETGKNFQKAVAEEVMLKAITALTDKMEKIETKVNSITNVSNDRANDNAAGGGGRNRCANKRFIKCGKCEERRVYCTHCSICGQGGHKRRDCAAAAGVGGPNEEEKNE